MKGVVRDVRWGWMALGWMRVGILGSFEDKFSLNLLKIQFSTKNAIQIKDKISSK
jgi:hypothetical protein